MKITVVASHPQVTMVSSGEQRLEVPTNWFPTQPASGQTWTVQLAHQLSDHEKIERLNSFLAQN